MTMLTKRDRRHCQPHLALFLDSTRRRTGRARIKRNKAVREIWVLGERGRKKTDGHMGDSRNNSAGCIPPPARITTCVAVTTPIEAVPATAPPVATIPVVAAAPALVIVSPPSVALVAPAAAVATTATVEAAPAALVAAARVAGRRVVAALQPPQESVGLVHLAVGASIAASAAVAAAVAIAVAAAVVRAGSITALGALRLLPLPFLLADQRVLAVRLGARLVLGLLLRRVPVARSK